MSFLVTWVHPQQNPRFCLPEKMDPNNPCHHFFRPLPETVSFCNNGWEWWNITSKNCSSLTMLKFSKKVTGLIRFDDVDLMKVEVIWRLSLFFFPSEDQLLKKVCKLANALRAEGVKKGDRPGFLVVWDGDCQVKFFFFRPKKWPPPPKWGNFNFSDIFAGVLFFLYFFFVRNICFHLGCNGICDTLDMFFLDSSMTITSFNRSQSLGACHKKNHIPGVTFSGWGVDPIYL